MRSRVTLFKPEVQPMHSVKFQIASNMELTEEMKAFAVGNVLKAGRLLESVTVGKRIELAPMDGVKIVAPASTNTGVLAHDIDLQEMEIGDILNVGVLIDAVVYKDVMESVNGVLSDVVITALKDSGITLYDVTTIK